MKEKWIVLFHDDLFDFSVESLKHLAAYICDLNLADNRITSLGQFALFPRLTHLLLDDNPVER